MNIEVLDVTEELECSDFKTDLIKIMKWFINQTNYLLMFPNVFYQRWDMWLY